MYQTLVHLLFSTKRERELKERNKGTHIRQGEGFFLYYRAGYRRYYTLKLKYAIMVKIKATFSFFLRFSVTTRF